MMCRLLRLQTELLPDVTELLPLRVGASTRPRPAAATVLPAAARAAAVGVGYSERHPDGETVFGDRGKPALALARPLPHQTFARHQKTRVNHCRIVTRREL